MLESNEMKVLGKIVKNIKINRTRSRQIREFCGIQPINEWMVRMREWDEHVTRIDAEQLVKISRDKYTCWKKISRKPEKKMK